MRKFGARGCQPKHWKTKRKRNQNFVSGDIRVASFVEGPKRFIVSSRFAGFALEDWRTKEKFRELKKPVGKL